MSKRAILVVVVVLACAIALIAYLRQRSYNHYNAGEVTTLETRESAAVAVEPPPARISKKESAGHPLDETTPSPSFEPIQQQPISSTKPAVGPAESARIAGSGRFQAYRQGNLTWRLDTENGTACVLFATDEEWQKPRVYRRACTQN